MTALVIIYLFCCVITAISVIRIAVQKGYCTIIDLFIATLITLFSPISLPIIVIDKLREIDFWTKTIWERKR